MLAVFREGGTSATDGLAEFFFFLMMILCLWQKVSI